MEIVSDSCEFHHHTSGIMLESGELQTLCGLTSLLSSDWLVLSSDEL